MEDMKFGAIFSPLDVRDYHIACATNTVFPDAFELDMPKAKDQGKIGSCVANALALVVEYFSRQQDEEYGDMSVGYIYGNRSNMDYTGQGMITRYAIDQMREYGDVVEELFPYNEEVPEVLDKFNDKKEELYNIGRRHRFSSYYRCNNQTEIKTALMKKNPVILSMNWYLDSKVNDVGVITTSQSGSYYGHCMVIYGWNKNGWLIQNSWGENWGINGRATLPYTIPIKEAWGVSDDIYRKKEIEQLTDSNKALNTKIAELNASISNSLNDLSMLTDHSNEQKLTIDELNNRIVELTKNLQDSYLQLQECQEELTKQTNRIKELEQELVEIKKPYDSPIGKVLAKIFNFIINTLNKYFVKE